MKPKPYVYIESTVVSYLTAKSSRDLVIAAHQQITQEWWEKSLTRFQPYISQMVLLEIGAGDPEAATKRLESVMEMPVLEIRPEDERLAQKYLREIPMPGIAFRDAVHMAVASANGMHYLLTWNCRHLARGEVRAGLLRVNDKLNIMTPEICTPEELMED